MILLENSFYATPADLATLLTDKQKVADIFYMNFIGFIGLLKLKDAPTLNSYIKTLGKIQLQNMNDTSKDWALSVKLAHDSGIINQPAAMSITRFLAAVKMGKITTADIKDEPIRDLLKACRIVQHKPSQRLYQVVSDFIDAKDNLEATTAKIWRLSSKPEHATHAQEFREQITLGGYSSLLLKHQYQHGSMPSAVATPAPVMVAPSKGNRGTLPPVGAAAGTDSEYMAALLHIFKLKGGIHSYLDRFGFKSHFDLDRFRKAIASPEFVIAHGYHVPWSDHPFVQWIRKKDHTAATAVVKILNDKEKNKSDLAQSVQVANSQPAPTPPPVVIQTIPDPILSAESIHDLYYASNTTVYSSVLKKYNISELADVRRKLFRERQPDLRSLLEKLKVPELAAEVNRENYLKYTVQSPFAQDMNFVMSGYLFVPIIHTIKDLVAKKDEQGFLNVLNDRYTASEIASRSTIFTSRDEVAAAVRALAGDSPAGFIARNALFLRTNGLENVYKTIQALWNPGIPLDLIRTNFCGFIFEGIGHGVHPDLTARNQIQKAFQSIGVNVYPGSTWLVDKETKGLIPKDILAVMDALDEIGVVKFSYETIDTDKVKSAALKNLISTFRQSYSVESAKTVLGFVKEAMAGGFNIGTLLHDESIRNDLSYIMGSTALNPSFNQEPDLRDKVYDWIFTNLAKIPSLEWTAKTTFGTYDSAPFANLALPFMTWCHEKGQTEALRNFGPYALSFNSIGSDFLKIALAHYPQFNDICFEGFKFRSTNGAMRAQYLGWKFVKGAVEDLNIESLCDYAGACAAHDDIKAAMECVHYSLSKYKSSFVEPWTVASGRYSIPFMSTAWFIKQGDPHYEEAKTTVSIATVNVFSSKQGFKEIVREYNPELFEFWSEKLISDAKGSPAKAIDLKSALPKEQFSKILVESFKGVSTDTIKADLKSQHGLATRILALSKTDELDTDAKIVLLKMFAPAMEVANVYDIRDKSQRDFINGLFTDLLLDVYDEDKALANKIFRDAPRTTRTIIVKQQGEQDYLEAIAADLYKHPIKPDFPLDHKRIRTILKYNRIPMRITSNRGLVQKIEDIAVAVKSSIGKVGDLKVSEDKMDDEALDRATIRLNKFRNNNHGDVGIKILKSFNVEFPGNKSRIEAFRAQYPRDGTLIPVFHGTGTVAASMVLRNGFQIIPSSDTSTAGRMLGNGIYFSNISNKASQYVGDKGGGITRRYGTRGYVFEMEAELGQSGKHYRSAGTSGDLSVRSPEWAVYNPADQLRIYKAYYVELVNIEDVKTIAAKYGEKLTESSMKSFDDFLFEANIGKDVSTFWFMGDSIPNTPEEIIDAGQYQPRAHVFAEPFGDGGTMVSIAHSKDIDAVSVTVPNTSEWLVTKPDEVQKFFELIKA